MLQKHIMVRNNPQRIKEDAGDTMLLTPATGATRPGAGVRAGKKHQRKMMNPETNPVFVTADARSDRD